MKISYNRFKDICKELDSFEFNPGNGYFKTVEFIEFEGTLMFKLETTDGLLVTIGTIENSELIEQRQ